jgi:hypothetical protein
MQIARRFAAVSAVSALLLVSNPARAIAATPPPPTTSRYMKTTDGSVLYAEGCAAGRVPQRGIAVLDFGSPALSGTAYGSLLFNSNSFRSTSQIAAAAKNWLQGYWNCSPYGPEITLAIGTSNYRGQTNSSHGRAWAQMVNSVVSWISQKGYGSQLDVAGASDMELNWNTASATRAWANGYDSSDMRGYFNYGDAAGCPPYGSCNNGWTQEDVWFVSYGSPPAFPLPEIYTTNGSMAAEWYRLSLYGYTAHGRAMWIPGEMTQYQACIDSGNTCAGTNNTPAAGWTQLYSKLNADWRTAQSLPNSTDITWKN